MLDNTLIKLFRILPTIGLLSMLGACVSSVVVKPEIPPPLVVKTPINAHMSYSKEFKSFTYKEKEKGRALSNLSVGKAQTILFDGIFSNLTSLQDADSPDLDVVIEPEILDVQYTSPKETNLSLYEVWLKYRVKISNSEDKKLADWVIKGYGKTSTGTLGSSSAAFNRAANIALRDVGAQLSIGFPNQPAMKNLIAQKNTNQLDANTAVTLLDEAPNNEPSAENIDAKLDSNEEQ